MLFVPITHSCGLHSPLKKYYLCVSQPSITVIKTLKKINSAGKIYFTSCFKLKFTWLCWFCLILEWTIIAGASDDGQDWSTDGSWKVCVRGGYFSDLLPGSCF